jgi:hypothetical protein
VARRQQRRAGEQFLAQGAGTIVALVGAALLQDRHDQLDEILEALGGHDAAEVEAVDIGLVDPGDQVLGDLLGRATMAGLRLPRPIRLTMRRKVHGSVLNVVSVSTAELIALFFT